MDFYDSLTSPGFTEIGAETKNIDGLDTIGARQEGRNEFADENYGWAGEDIFIDKIFISLLDREYHASCLSPVRTDFR